MSSTTLHANDTFPDAGRKRVAILVINPDGLPSAQADATHLSRLFNMYLHFDDIHVLMSTNAANKALEEEIDRMNAGHLTVCECLTPQDVCHMLTHTVKSLASNALPTDIVVEFSSHGYFTGTRNYLLWHGQLLWDTAAHDAIVPFLPESIRCLVLVDACACGEFMVLSYQTTDLVHYKNESKHPDFQHPNVVCISAVSNQQFDMDDISDLGFGGGLSCAWIDYHIEHIDGDRPSIGGFHRYYQARIRPTNNVSILSFNDSSFLQ